MKSEYFNKRAQSTQLRGHREKPKPKQTNWDRIVYLILLIVGLGFFFYYIFINSFYTEGEGLVVTETIKVQAPDDIEIREQLVSNDSYVIKGAPLFRYTFINWDGIIEEIEEIEEEIADVKEEVQELDNEITLKRQSIQEYQKRIILLEQDKEDLQEKIRLNAATSYELNDLERSLFTARSSLRRAQSELSILINNRNRRIEKREALASEVKELQSEENRLQTYNSPASGVINNISVRENQQAFRSDQILSLKPDNADVYIFSVFDRKDAEHVQPGTVMNIEFDNETKSVGVIRSTYDARENLIDHFEQTGSLTTDYLVVELAPLDSVTRALWFQLDRSGLSVFRRKVGNRGERSSDEAFSSQINTADETEYESVPSESDSTIITQSDQVLTSTTSTSAEQESATSSAPDANKTNELSGVNDKYGLLGGSFIDQLDGFTINLYSFKDLEKASDVSSEIKNQGYRVDVNPVSINNTEYWRVTVGQFRTIENAHKAAETLPAPLKEEYFIHRIKYKR